VQCYQINFIGRKEESVYDEKYGLHFNNIYELMQLCEVTELLQLIIFLGR
ncbi:hypothetical protein LINPERPRIM_LOCUS27548, partial [Linum perenne]